MHAAFDGGRLPRADQCKTNWGPRSAASIEALAATPLDASRPETWLKLAERIGDSIAHDHVATILLAGWPGAECEYFDDLAPGRAIRPRARQARHARRILSRHPRAGRLDDVQSARVSEPAILRNGANPISSQVDAYRRDVRRRTSNLATGLAAVAGLKLANDGQNGVRSRWSRSIRGTSRARSSSESIRLNLDNQPAARRRQLDASRFCPMCRAAASRRLQPPVGHAAGGAGRRPNASQRAAGADRQREDGRNSIAAHAPRSQHAGFAAARVSSRRAASRR